MLLIFILLRHFLRRVAACTLIAICLPILIVWDLIHMTLERLTPVRQPASTLLSGMIELFTLLALNYKFGWVVVGVTEGKPSDAPAPLFVLCLHFHMSSIPYIIYLLFQALGAVFLVFLILLFKLCTVLVSTPGILLLLGVYVFFG